MNVIYSKLFKRWVGAGLVVVSLLGLVNQMI